MNTKLKTLLSRIFGNLYLTAKAESEEEEVKVEEVEAEEKEEETEEEETETETTQEEEVEEKPKQKESPTEKEIDPIAKARKEEKNKLYGKIQDLEGQREKLHKINAEKDKEMNKLKSELEKMKESNILLEKKVEELQKDSENKNGNETVEYQELYLKYTTLQEEHEKLVEEHQAELNRLELEGYRSKLVAKHSKEIIPELIQGSTKEELDEALKLSKKRYKEIINNVRRKTSVPDVDYGAESDVKADSLNSFTTEEIRNLSPEEWAEARKQLLRK